MQLPEQFIERTKPLLKDEWEPFCNALDEKTPVSIRVNTAKKGVAPVDAKSVAWCASGYYLEQRPSFVLDPLFHAGGYYPQEASSMFVEQVVKQQVDAAVRALDLCAAPGGKSTHLLSLLPEGSLLVANEVIRSRAGILSENITKWGNPHVVVTNNDPAEIGKLAGFFDVMLVDAPCSGEGMFRKDAAAANEWSEANVQLCKERQQRILADVWPTLKPGGLLIYSTCTYNTDENEDNVQWICNTLGADPVLLDIRADWNITGALQGDLPVYRFLPHKTRGEGFFLAVMRKTGDEEVSSGRFRKRKDTGGKTKKLLLDNRYQCYLKNNDDFLFIASGEKWRAIPKTWADDYNRLSAQLRIVSAGVELGEQKGKDFIPAASLAFSQGLDVGTFPAVEIDLETAIAYLRKESIALPDGVEKGYVLLTYQQTPLGFVKNIGMRANNLYPAEWRIRTRRTL